MPAVAAIDEQQGVQSHGAVRSGYRSWLASFFFHAILLVLLAFFALPGISKQTVHLLEGSLAADDSSPQLASASVAIGDPLAVEPESQEVESPAEVPTTDTAVPQVTAKEIEPEPVVDPPSVKLLASKPANSFGDPRAPRSRAVSDIQQLGRANGMGDAVNGIGDSIRGDLLQADTLVVWLIDASASVEENRLAMVRHAGELYRSIRRLAGQGDVVADGHVLSSSVVVFGSEVAELVPPTTNGSKAVEAMWDIPIDTTGTENVMAAVDQTVDMYRSQFAGKRMLVALLTDESGDDTGDLEATIRRCREAGVAVHVIGPTAAMGCGLGSQHCTVRERGVNYSFWLNVNRGPETPRPERCFLPYWHQSPLPPWKQQGAWAVQNAQWFGGPFRERVLSGFGPHGLTRLALQTGGTYTMYDADRRGRSDGLYDLEVLRDYAPEYGPADQYEQSLLQRPLRQFVIDAANISLTKQETFMPPRLTFIAERSRYYPYNEHSVYYPPAEFRRRLPAVLEVERAAVRSASEQIADLIARLEDADTDWELEYDGEESKRWRASFVLAKGRLLASQARYVEYLAATDAIMSALRSDTNEVSLRPAESLRAPSSAALVEAAQRCLQRCINENPDTPWEDLARWELEHPCGLRIEQSTIRPQRSNSLIASPTQTPTEFTFPNL
jgi:hypothetical protein